MHHCTTLPLSPRVSHVEMGVCGQKVGTTLTEAKHRWVQRKDRRNSAWKRRSSTQENRVARASLPSFRVVGAAVALITLASTPFFPALMPKVPRVFVACFFTWLAAVFLRESVWEVFVESPDCWSDGAVVIVMMAVMPVVGFLEGILVGLVLSCVTNSFSRTLTTNVIQLRSDGRTIRSNTARLPAHAGFLRHNGDAIVVVHLQGDIGFATCRQITGLVEDLAQRKKTELGGSRGTGQEEEEEESSVGKFVVVEPVERKAVFLVVCMRNVSTLDYSAAQQLVKMGKAAVRSHAGQAGGDGESGRPGTPLYIVYTRCQPTVRQALLHCGCVREGDVIATDVQCHVPPPVSICDSYMHALAMCEDALLREATECALVPPQLPVLPEGLDAHGRLEPVERRDVSETETALQREADEGNASQYSVASYGSESEGRVRAAPRVSVEANAVGMRDLMAIVFGPYMAGHMSAATNSDEHLTAAMTISQYLEVMLTSMRTQRLECGEALWRCGDASPSMYVVHAGKLHVALPKGSAVAGDSAGIAADTRLDCHPREQLHVQSIGVSDPAEGRQRGGGVGVGDGVGEARQQSQESLVLEVLIPGSILGFTDALSTPPQMRFTDCVVVSKWAVVHELPLARFQELQMRYPSLAMGIMQCALHRCAMAERVLLWHVHY